MAADSHSISLTFHSTVLTAAIYFDKVEASHIRVCGVLTVIVIGLPEHANIGETQYLCYHPLDQCSYICGPITATFRKNGCFCDLICINLHISLIMQILC